MSEEEEKLMKEYPFTEEEAFVPEGKGILDQIETLGTKSTYAPLTAEAIRELMSDIMGLPGVKGEPVQSVHRGSTLLCTSALR